MTSKPYFSVVIPTKGRSFLVGFAIQSVLRQSFPDFEIIVADNDDGDATREAVMKFQDPRLRYLRTGGLSMPDNCEAGFAAAEGECLCLLTDRMAWKGRTLERAHAILEREHCAALRWLNDIFDDDTACTSVLITGGDGSLSYHTSDEILDRFANGSLWEAARWMAIPQQSAVSRSLVARLREGPMRRVFPPISPDFTMAFQVLALADGVHFLDAALAVGATRHSNGRGGILKNGLFRQFKREIGGRDDRFYDRTWIKADLVENSVYNDFLEVQAAHGGRLARFALDPAQYFAECHHAILKSVREGVNMKAERAAWEAALQAQPPDVRAAVLRRLAAITPLWRQNTQAWLRGVRKRVGLLTFERRIRTVVRELRGSAKEQQTGQFVSILDYIEWADSVATPS